MVTKAVSVSIDEDVLKEANKVLKQNVGKYRGLSHYVEFSIRQLNIREKYGNPKSK